LPPELQNSDLAQESSVVGSEAVDLVGSGVGDSVGSGVGDAVGSGVGDKVGPGVGDRVGSGVGAGVGSGVGDRVGSGVGAGVGDSVGTGVGEGVGSGVGDGVGAGVGGGGTVSKSTCAKLEKLLSLGLVSAPLLLRNHCGGKRLSLFRLNRTRTFVCVVPLTAKVRRKNKTALSLRSVIPVTCASLKKSASARPTARTLDSVLNSGGTWPT